MAALAVATLPSCGESLTCEKLATCAPSCDVAEYACSHLDECSDATNAATCREASAPRSDARAEPERDASVDVASDVGARSDAADGGADVSLDTSGGARDVSVEDSEAGFDAGADVQEEEATPPCDATKTPSEDGCVIDARYGVFVSPLGSDTMGLGTETAPYKTLARAVTVAQGRRIYACATAGTFDEKVTIAAGATLFGGFDCTGSEWSYLNTRSALVRPSTTGIVLTMSGAQRIEIENVAFEARDATEAGGSSVTAFANGAASVVMRRVTLLAGSGRPGAEVTTVGNYTAAAASNGSSTTTAAGAATQTCAAICANGVHSTGGRGGVGAAEAPAGSGANGAPTIVPASPDVATGVAGTGDLGDGSGCGTGRRGSDAPTAAGGSGAATWGTLSANGWAPSRGNQGIVGVPGQGGGGGGGGVVLAGLLGGGGGGACGGCGGAGGPAGNTGGSSIALLSFTSGVTLDASVLTAAAAGSGSNGGDGQEGQAGGLPGSAAVAGCPGGMGGFGAQGGGGGGGAGGLSASLAYVGTLPNLDAATTTRFASSPALGGAPGAGGAPVATKGRDGIAQASINLMP